MRSDFELGYRLSLSYVLTQMPPALRAPDRRPAGARCRLRKRAQHRAYIDLGLRPDATRRHRSARRRDRAGASTESRHRLPRRRRDGPRRSDTFTWVQAATVHSSVESHESRRELVDAMTRLVAPGGYLFYFDIWRANGFAGHDVIDVERLHAGFETVWSTSVRAHHARPRLRNRLTVIRNGRSLPEVVRHVARPRTRWEQLRHPSHRAHSGARAALNTLDRAGSVFRRRPRGSRRRRGRSRRWSSGTSPTAAPRTPWRRVRSR